MWGPIRQSPQYHGAHNSPAVAVLLVEHTLTPPLFTGPVITGVAQAQPSSPWALAYTNLSSTAHGAVMQLASRPATLGFPAPVTKGSFTAGSTRSS